MRIMIIGAGYVGLVSSACFAELGHNVVCVDTDSEKIKGLNQGIMPFFEPGIKDLVSANLLAARLQFSLSIKDNINNVDVIFICVGTPPKKTGQADLSQVFQAAEEIGRSIKQYAVIVTKSTVPVGAAKKIRKIISANYHSEYDVASCPEFLREGTAIKDFMCPDRIVIGTESLRAREWLVKLHEKIECPKILTEIATAEMIKYASNAFLATKISFINEVANVCELVGADVERVAEGMGYDKRIGRAFLNAGIGYGGSCFPKDVRALHHIAEENGCLFQLLKAGIEVNSQQKWLFYKKIKTVLGNLEEKSIGVWGLSFKPETDDIRESIAIELIEKLIEDGAKVKVYDPVAMANAQKVLGDRVGYCFSAAYAAEAADALLIMTEWDEFRNFDFNILRGRMRQQVVIDGRNLYDKAVLSSLGFNYLSVGRQ